MFEIQINTAVEFWSVRRKLLELSNSNLFTAMGEAKEIAFAPFGSSFESPL